jgi:PAS domain S-box-containing protein
VSGSCDVNWAQTPNHPRKVLVVANKADRPIGGSAGTITSDKQGFFVQWGDVACDTFGYSSDEAVGRRIDLIIPPVLRAWHWHGFNRAMASGRRRWLYKNGRKVGAPALHKDGRIVPLRAILDLTYSDAGTPQGAVVTILGTGPAWRGTAWRVALAPLNLAQQRFARARK